MKPEVPNNDRSDSEISRRSFLLGLAGITCLTLPLPADSTVGLFEPFSFAVISDVHLCNDRADTFMLLRESQLFLQEVVGRLNEEKLDFVIFTGDQVEVLGRNQANWQLFQDIAQSINAPWSFVLGERDLADDLPVDKIRTYGPDWKSRGIETDKSYWSQSPLPGVHIIGLDTSRPNSPTGDMGTRQLEWLKGDLTANKRKFTIVFSHHPLLPPPPYDGGPPWDDYILPPGPVVREVLGSSPYVKLAISGHVYASKVQREKDIWYVSCPGLVVYPCAYRIFKVTPDAITMETRQIAFPALVKKAKKLLIGSSPAYKYSSSDPESFVPVLEGARVDNDALLPLPSGKEAQALPKSKPPKAAKKKKEKKEKKSKRSKGDDGSESSDKQGQTNGSTDSESKIGPGKVSPPGAEDTAPDKPSFERQMPERPPSGKASGPDKQAQPGPETLPDPSPVPKLERSKPDK